MAEFTTEQVDQFKGVFDLFDKDKNGTISAQEIGAVMRSLSLDPSDEELEDIMNEADRDGNGTLDFHEFLEMMSKKVKPMDENEELRQAFKVFDKDGSGTISKSELRDVMRSLGENLSEAELDDMMKEADIDKSGSIDFEEFLKLMGQV